MFEYRVNQNGEVTITGYKGDVTEVIIPSEIEGKPVTGIGDSAFSRCISLTSVTIPNSATSVGYCAFYDCYSLTSIEIPNSVKSIGAWAFSYCNSLKSVEIPNSVTSIMKYAFFRCNNLEEVWYSGTEEQWKQIKIGRYNSALNKAKKHFKNA